MSPGSDGLAPALIGYIKRLCQGWSSYSPFKGLQSFPLTSASVHGNLSSKTGSLLFPKVLESMSANVCLIAAPGDTSASPIQHLHTQVYHRSRVTLRRTQAVQDLSMGLFTPRIALRAHRLRDAKNIIHRIQGPHALGMDGEASERRFHQKLRDMPRCMGYESMVMIDMALVQDSLKQAK